MKSEFFYSNSTGLYISRSPLRIDSRVKLACKQSGIELEWDDEGRINYSDYNKVKKIIEAIGGVLLNPIEYWKVLKEANESGDGEMVNSLMSKDFCEWLDRVYLREGIYIDHPVLAGEGYEGERKPLNFPEGSPGWFDPEGNLDEQSGHPIEVIKFRGKFSTSWKYWSPALGLKASFNGVTAPIRGYVTSVGKPSFDLGIPVDSKQPKLMIRECRREPLEDPLDESLAMQVKEFLKLYDAATESRRDWTVFSRAYSEGRMFTKFLIENGEKFSGKESSVSSIRERIVNLLGLLFLMAKRENDLELEEHVSKASEKVSGMRKTCKYEDFLEFITSSRDRLKKAISSNLDIVFVMGHKNPDSDTVVSSIFESWRNQLIERRNVEFIPVVQCEEVPSEIRKLLGERITDSLILTNERQYLIAKREGLARWISVDQNREPEVQKFFISIVDHHILSDTARDQRIPKTIEWVGSCVGIIAQKFVGSGLIFDNKIAQIFYGAALMDTENRVAHKMTIKDELVMDYLKNISNSDDSEIYRELMSCLLNSENAKDLFRRDYKEDWGFGFAVVKVKNCFYEGRILKENLIRDLRLLSKNNTESKNLPMTLLRITDYLEDNESVNRERVYVDFNKTSSKNFIKSVFEVLEAIVKFEFPDSKIKKSKDYLEFWGSGKQLSRKKTAPIMEKVVKYFHLYFYSKTLGIWVGREFVKKTKRVEEVCKSEGIRVSTDEEDRICYVTFRESKRLCESLGFTMLSSSEFFRVLGEVKSAGDRQLVESMQGSNFVEFLDSIILNSEILIDHPDVEIFNGKRKRVKIEKMNPGLFNPVLVDSNGIPTKVLPPNVYGNPELWRYWPPDAEIVNPTRSFIFLLGQPCWDGKFHPEDSLPNLGIRPCCNSPEAPLMKVSFGKELRLEIESEGEKLNFSWKKD